MIVTVCADKGSPGVSTVATVLAMVWPGERLLLEADPSGGDAALRLRTPQGRLLARQPTVRGLAVDARGGVLPRPVSGYAQQTSLGVPVIPAADMSSADLRRIAPQWPAVAKVAAAWTGTVVADLGRLQENSAAGWLASASASVLLVGRAGTEGMYHLRVRAAALAGRLGSPSAGRSPLAVALICPARQHTAALRDLAEHLGADPGTERVPVAGWIAEDPRGARALWEGRPGRRLTGSALVASTIGVAETLLSWGRPPAGTEPVPAATPEPVRPAGPAGPAVAGPVMGSGGWR